MRGARLDISRELPTKRRAIAAHASQCTDVLGPARLNPEFLAFFQRAFEVFLTEDASITE
jgi:LmbE family N-acetylglucosaminyl deacetylase